MWIISNVVSQYPDLLEKQTLPATSSQAHTGGIGGERYELIPPSAAPSTFHHVTAERYTSIPSGSGNTNIPHTPAVNPSSVDADPKLSPLPPKPAHLPMHQVHTQNTKTTANHTDVLARMPPTRPILLPEYRVCKIEQHVKPMRTHHCRICGTVRHFLKSAIRYLICCHSAF